MPIIPYLGVCPPIYGTAIIRSLSFLFLDDFEGNANISVAIESGSTVIAIRGDKSKVVRMWEAFALFY